MNSEERQGVVNRLGAVIGMFDGVHRGHRYLFEQLFAICHERNLQPAVITFGAHPLETINPAIAPALISSPEEKIELLEQAGFQHSDILMLRFNEDMRNLSAREFMGILHQQFDVDLILRGFNNRFGTERHLTSEDYRRIGKEEHVEIVDAKGYCHDVDGEEIIPSSSEIRRRLESGDLATANLLLGHPYKIIGKVVAGKQLGRKIGFPTANIQPSIPNKLLPPDGVYVAKGYIFSPDKEGDFPSSGYPVMVNIGTRPTVDGVNDLRTIEAHFIGLGEPRRGASTAEMVNLYNHKVELEFLHFLRPEVTFPSVDILHQQLEADRAATLQYFADNMRK